MKNDNLKNIYEDYFPVEPLLFEEENNMEAKPFYKSRTLWLAVAQAVVGIWVAVTTNDPTLATTGWGALVKSLVDVYLRFSTTKPVL